MEHLCKIKAAAITAAVVMISFIFLYIGTSGHFDQGFCDRLNQREDVTNKKIYIIGIDDKTLGQY